MGEEPDGQFMLPEDYGALYVQWADAIHAVDPRLKLGGPGFQTTLEGWQCWPDAQGNSSWMKRFLAYLKRRGRLRDFDFFSFEWYPFDRIERPAGPQLATEPRLLETAMRMLRGDGVSTRIPWIVTEYGYSSFAGEPEMDLPGALLNAEVAAHFLALGGSAAYLYGYEPNIPIREAAAGMTWGNLAMFLSNKNRAIRCPLPAYSGAVLLSQRWAQPGSGLHTVYRAGAYLRNRRGDPLLTAYTVRRPDGRLAVMLLNKDPARAHRVRVLLGAGAGGTKPFPQAEAWQYGPDQYKWRASGANGHPVRNMPPAHLADVAPANAFDLPPYSLTVLRTQQPLDGRRSLIPGLPQIPSRRRTMLTGLLLALALAGGATPIALHPDNPHYFLFRGKPTILLTSAEHYGAVLNADFDNTRYLKELQSRRLNYTRIFTGAYCEDPRSFNIRDNTLAPAPGRLSCPWARSSTPGYAKGGAKFDLKQWDESYFRRLKAFCTEAGRRGIVVEVSLFCPFYDESMWVLSPMNARNNVNGIGSSGREEVYALKHADLTEAQDAMTRKLARELAGHDNVIFEICNEPYFGGVTLAWQRHVATVIADEERKTGVRHLIAQNIANGSARVMDPDPEVSILNFHYAAPPNAVAENYSLHRAIGFDETGFKGSADLPYRTEGWDFLMAGGAVFNNLDYSFTVRSPEGAAPVAPPTPGGGGPELRRQLGILRQFFSRLNFIRMQPANDLLASGLPQGVTARVFAEPGRVYAAYIKGGKATALVLDLPTGRYTPEWVHPKTGETERAPTIAHAGGRLDLPIPAYEVDIALRLARR